VEDQMTVFDLSRSGERVVRRYQCTQVHRLFAPTTPGYLTITNQRIVYHCVGQTATVKSLLLSEMPVQDAAGVSVYVGRSINWAQYIFFALALYILSAVLDEWLPKFFTSWILGMLLMVPFALLKCYRSRWLSQEAKDAIRSVLQWVGGSPAAGRDSETWTSRLRWLFLAGVAILGWALVHGALLGYLWFRSLPLGVFLLAVVYFVLYIAVFGRQSVFSLSISSRSAQTPSIYIPGSTFRLFTGVHRSVVDSLSRRAGIDATTLARELGALLTDICALGDLGVEKWTTVHAEAET